METRVVPAQEPSAARVRVGVVGAGAIGRSHAAIAARLPGCRLVGLVDPDPAARETATGLGVPWFSGHQALVETAAPEGVVIATPTGTHVAVGTDCARRGLGDHPGLRRRALPLVLRGHHGGEPLLLPHLRGLLSFFGTAGTLAFPSLTLIRYADPRAAGWQHPLVSERLPVGSGDPLTAQLAHFCRVVRGLEPPRTDGEDALRTLAVAQAVLTAGRTGRPVSLEAHAR